MIESSGGARTVVGSALVAAVAIGGLLVGTGTAAAAPGSCTTSKNSSTATGSATCRSGSGTFRVVVTCVDGFTGETTVQYGPWKGVGGTSTRQCYPAQRSSISSVGVQKRD